MSSRFADRARCAALAMLALAALGACRREKRDFHSSPPPAAVPAESARAVHPDSGISREGPYGDNAYALSQGKQLFTAFNCLGCHAHGGGGMGPPLMDSAAALSQAPRA